MTPSELDFISLALLPGASMTRRAKHIAPLTGHKYRMVLYWFQGKHPVPKLAEEKLQSEYRKALRRQARKMQNSAIIA